MGRTHLALLGTCALAIGTGRAHANLGTERASVRRLGSASLTDGGAIPFMSTPRAARLVLAASTRGGIALGAAAVARERAIHDRDPLLDVTAGALLGTTSSPRFYRDQRSRLDDERSDGVKLAIRRVKGGGTGATIGIKFAW